MVKRKGLGPKRHRRKKNNTNKHRPGKSVMPVIKNCQNLPEKRNPKDRASILLDSLNEELNKIKNTGVFSSDYDKPPPFGYYHNNGTIRDFGISNDIEYINQAGIAAFTNRHIKGIAGKCRKLAELMSEISSGDGVYATENDFLITEYKEFLKNLKASRLYGVLVKRRQGLGVQIAEFEVNFPYIKIGTDTSDSSMYD